MTLLHGGGAKGTGRRRGDKQRTPDADSGPILRSLLPRTAEPGDDTTGNVDGPRDPNGDLSADIGSRGGARCSSTATTATRTPDVRPAAVPPRLPRGG